MSDFDVRGSTTFDFPLFQKEGSHWGPRHRPPVADGGHGDRDTVPQVVRARGPFVTRTVIFPDFSIFDFLFLFCLIYLFSILDCWVFVVSVSRQSISVFGCLFSVCFSQYRY